MVAVGEKLGGRYFVVKLDAKMVPGVVIEVRDAQASVFHAQLLGSKPLGRAEIDQLARDVAAVPQNPSLLLPDEISQSPGGDAFAIFSTALPPSLTEVLPSYRLVSKDQALALQKNILMAFATLCDDLYRAVGGRSMHGAIQSAHVRVLAEKPELKLALSGFGIDAAERLSAKRERPNHKVDPSAMFLLAHEALQVVGALPEGAALVKWNVLLNCARGGDHPALQSNATLAKFLRDTFWELAQTTRPASPSTVTPPPVPAPSPASSSRLTDVRAWFDANRTKVGIGVGLALVAAVGLAVVFSGDNDRSTPQPATSSAASRDASTSTPAPGPALPCGAESTTNPSTVELSGGAWWVEGVCAPEGAGLRTLAMSGGALLTAERAPRRGSPFIGNLHTLSERVREPGTTVAAEGTSWVAWQPFDGHFALARLAPQPREVALATEGWSNTQFHGAFLLSVDARGTWIASTLQEAAGATVVAARIPFVSSGETSMTLYSLGEGSVVSVIAGESAHLLVRARGETTSLTVVTASTNVLPVLAPAPATPMGDASTTTPSALRMVPEVALRRTEALVLQGAVTAAPTGVATRDGVRFFLVTTGTAVEDERCHGAPCVPSGTVSLLTFAPQGTPTSLELAPVGRGASLGLNGQSHPVAVVVRDASFSFVTRTDTQTHHEVIPLRALAAAYVLPCGDEPWLAFATGVAPAKFGALPLACLSRYSAQR